MDTGYGRFVILGSAAAAFVFAAVARRVLIHICDFYLRLILNP